MPVGLGLWVPRGWHSMVSGRGRRKQLWVSPLLGWGLLLALVHPHLSPPHTSRGPPEVRWRALTPGPGVTWNPAGCVLGPREDSDRDQAGRWWLVSPHEGPRKLCRGALLSLGAGATSPWRVKMGQQAGDTALGGSAETGRTPKLWSGVWKAGDREAPRAWVPPDQDAPLSSSVPLKACSSGRGR